MSGLGKKGIHHNALHIRNADTTNLADNTCTRAAVPPTVMLDSVGEQYYIGLLGS